MKPIHVLWGALVLAGARNPNPQETRRSSDVKTVIDSVFAPYDHSDTPGCTCAVSRNGTLLHDGAYGMADLEHRVALTPSSVFYVASVSKQFTAGSVALLAQRGAVSLDDDVSRWLPELGSLPGKVTVADLLHHTSGLRDYFGLFRLAGDDGLLDNARILDMLARQRSLAFAPGSQFSYSNSNYIALAELVQRASGRTLRDFTTEEFFRPLGMTRSGFDDDHRRIVPDRVISYEHVGGTYRRYDKAYDGVGDGGLLSTAGDLVCWGDNLIDARVGGRAWRAMMSAPGVLRNGETLDYGLGLRLGAYRGVPSIGHSGGFEGFRAQLDVYPDSGLVIAVLCNAEDSNPGALAQSIADRLLGLAEPQRAWANDDTLYGETVRPLPASELSRYEGTFWSASEQLVRPLAVRGDKLYYVRPNSFDSELLPIGDGRFLMVGMKWRIFVAFDRTSSGDAFALEIDGREPVGFMRVTPWMPPQQSLQAHTGMYVSDEIGATYTISPAGDALVLQMPRVGEVQLHPVSPGLFTGRDDNKSYAVHMEYDEYDHPTSFALDSGWIIGLRFAKR